MPGPPPVPPQAGVQQPVYQAMGGNAAPVGSPKKKRGCRSCCLFSFLLILIVAAAGVGFAYYKFREPASPIEREYQQIPDYFPPEP